MRGLIRRLLDHGLSGEQRLLAEGGGALIGTAAAGGLLGCLMAWCPALIDGLIH